MRAAPVCEIDVPQRSSVSIEARESDRFFVVRQSRPQDDEGVVLTDVETLDVRLSALFATEADEKHAPRRWFSARGARPHATSGECARDQSKAKAPHAAQQGSNVD